MLYTPETLAAMGRYERHLREMRHKLDDRLIAAKEGLR